jgi:hypothetical protein
MTKKVKNYSRKFFLIFFGSKTTIYLSLGLHIRNVQVGEEAFSSQKRSSNTSKHELLKLLLVIFALLDPDPLTRLNPDPIRIRNPAYDEEVAGRVGQAGAQPRVLAQETLVRRVRHLFPVPHIGLFSQRYYFSVLRIRDVYPGSRIRIKEFKLIHDRYIPVPDTTFQIISAQVPY